MKNFFWTLVLCLVVLHSPFQLQAQASKGMTLLEKGNPEAAQAAFLADVDDPQDGPIALYGLAMVFSDEEFERHQLDSAFAYIEACDRAYRQMPPKLKSKIFKKLSSGMIADQRRKIVNQAVERAKAEGSPEGWDFFLENFPKPPAAAKRMALRERNALLAQRAEQSDNWRDIKDILDRYTPSFAADTPPLLVKVQEALFHEWTRENGFAGFPRFQATFPDNAVSKDTLKNTLDQALLSSDPQALAAFVEKHPQSIFLPFAVDSLAARLSAGAPAALQRRFLAQNPNHELAGGVWKRYYEEMKEGVSDPALLEQFLHDNPEYPFPEELKADMAFLKQNREQLEFEAFIREPGVTAGFAFLDLFPGSSKAEQVKQRIAEMLLQPDAKRWELELYLNRYAAPGQRQGLLNRLYDLVPQNADLAEINTFEKAYPDFADKGRIAADKKRAEQNRLAAQAADAFRRRSFAPNINTNRDEYAPILSTDGRTLYLCRKVSGSEDIFVAHQDEQGNWSAPKPVMEWNTPRMSEAPESVSADGNTFFLFRSGKFYLSRKTTSGWSPPEMLASPFNRFNWQADLSIAADGRAMLFAAKSPGSSMDIYVSLLQADNSWSEPFSLGNTVNTPREDRSPFIHPDGKTLYFSSEGHGGFGALDIFMTKRLDDTWTNWSEPANLGPDINSPGNDWGFRVSTDGEFGYYAAMLNGNQDIMRTNLAADIRPEKVATITGRMVDAQGEPLDAEILWEDLETGEVVQVTRSDPATGEFFAVLPERKRYGYSVRKPGFFPLSGNVDLRSELGEIRLDKPMELVTIEEMKNRDVSLPLNNLFFETAQYDIQPESFPELKRLAQLIINERLSIEIHGHTDSVGSDASNQALSENRARAVRDYLIGEGCDGARIVAKGFGKNRPRATNDTEEGRAMNRRVEMRIGN